MMYRSEIFKAAHWAAKIKKQNLRGSHYDKPYAVLFAAALRWEYSKLRRDAEFKAAAPAAPVMTSKSKFIPLSRPRSIVAIGA